MATQGDHWQIFVDLNTSGIARGLQEVNGMLNALGPGAPGGALGPGGGYGQAALQPTNLAALGSPNTVATGAIAASQGEMRNLISAQGQVAA